MRKIITLLCFIVMNLDLFAQSNDVFVAVAMPSNSMLDNNTKTILKNKLLTICTVEGIAATECGAIAMIPEISILDEQLVEGGMRNIHTIETNITITIRNIITNTVFNTLNITSKGEGYSKIEALRSAIKKIDAQKYFDFAQKTKHKISDYYRNNASTLINKANTLCAQQQYGEAIALLCTYPESLANYPQVSAAIQKIYQQYLTQNCEEIMIMARAEYAKRNFDKAADIAASIAPSCSCFNSAKALLSSIKKDNDAVYKNGIEANREERKSKERMLTATINAAKDVAIAYFKREKNYLFFW
ncbi:hypothetical protein [uncultured Prevotella sp.]|uniref:hypothetical protein n=1 Tax=uncultured Prevotella sp. TaxID=159272 RepID=UPI0026327F16|nr:hypothetical protein [uncultured Prevotella sp.]